MEDQTRSKWTDIQLIGISFNGFSFKFLLYLNHTGGVSVFFISYISMNIAHKSHYLHVLYSLSSGQRGRCAVLAVIDIHSILRTYHNIMVFGLSESGARFVFEYAIASSKINKLHRFGIEAPCAARRRYPHHTLMVAIHLSNPVVGELHLSFAVVRLL